MGALRSSGHMKPAQGAGFESGNERYWGFKNCRSCPRSHGTYRWSYLFKKQDNEKELFKLQEKIIKGTYNPCPYQYFTIHDPKRRQIAVAPFKDRVVHHAVVNILEPVFEKSFIFYSYASRRGKGTHKAIEQAQKFIRKRPWYVKIFINILIDKILPLIY